MRLWCGNTRVGWEFDIAILDLTIAGIDALSPDISTWVPRRRAGGHGTNQSSRIPN